MTEEFRTLSATKKSDCKMIADFRTCSLKAKLDNFLFIFVFEANMLSIFSIKSIKTIATKSLKKLPSQVSKENFQRYSISKLILNGLISPANVACLEISFLFRVLEYL